MDGSIGKTLLTAFTAKFGSSFKVGETAKSVGIHRSSLSRYLGGEVEIHSSTFVALLKLVGIDVQESLRLQIGKNLKSQGPVELEPEFYRHLNAVLSSASPLVCQAALKGFISVIEKNGSGAERDSIEYIKRITSSMQTIRRAN